MKMLGLLLLLIATTIGCALGQHQEDLAGTVKLLQEQVNALLLHRQQDYDALEQSLKESIEKNTELIVLRNEIKQLRKELTILSSERRINGADKSSKTGIPPIAGNEMKNERLRVRWLGSAVNELRTELSQVLRARNTSEELAERSRLSTGIQLLRTDVSGVGRVVRELTTRVTKLEAGLTTVRLDIVAGKERNSLPSDTCAELTDQLNSLQLELKSLSFKCDTGCVGSGRHGASSHHTAAKLAHHRLDERLNKLEHKIGLVSRKRGHLLEIARAAVGSGARLTGRLELVETRLSNVSAANRELASKSESMFQTLTANQTKAARSIGQLEVGAARQAAELGVGREELASLKLAVQALSVSASKLQEKSEAQQATINRLQTMTSAPASIERLGRELEHVEDEYRLMVDGLPAGCEDARDGLSLLAPGPGAPMLAACRKGGWILVGRRTDGSLDFDRSWDEYARGFGSPLAEFWAGNEALHRLSRGNCTRLQVRMTDIEGDHWVANYEDFSVGSEDSGYRLRVDGYSGNATDAMAYQNNMAFSAKDRDMDISSTDCAANYHGGWWFSHCQHANLNGRYSLGLTWYRSDSNQWMAIASAELLLQRKEHCKHQMR